MFKRFWLFFSQAVTVILAMLFVLAAFKPEWLPNRFGQAASTGNPAPNLPVRVSEPVTAASSAQTTPTTSNQSILSYSNAASRAIPAVVNIVATKNTSKRERAGPTFEDLIFID